MSTKHINNNPRARFGWIMYDWANSVYSLTITTAIFPIYFHAMAHQVAVRTVTEESGSVHAMVPFLGFEVKSISLLSIAVALAYVVIGVISPLLGALADYGGHKKKFMMVFCGIGSLSCSLMYFFEASTFYLGFWLFVMAAFSWAGGTIFYDAFLPEVAEPKEYDRVSARGYAMGYIGSILLLVFNLTLVMFPQWYFDVSGKLAEIMAADPTLSLETATEQARSSFGGIASRISFLTVGIWWFVFAQVTFFTLKDVKPEYKPTNYISKGFEELKSVFRQLKELTHLKSFLIAFFCYNMGIQTVMYMGSSFGDVELQMTATQLIIFLLIINLIAIPGAMGFARMSERWGNLPVLMIGIILWVCICVGAYFVVDANGYYLIGGVVGFVMGGMQSLSRSTYSKLIPQTRDTASFFSFLAIVDKFAIVCGTFAFGIFTQTLGTRNSILFLTVFFALGLFIIYRLKKANPIPR